MKYQGKLERGLFVRRTSSGDKRYEIYIRLNGKPVPVRRTIDAQSDGEAVKKGRAKIAELDGGKHVVGRNDLSLAELCDEWEQWAKAPGSSYSARCTGLYPDLVKRHVYPVLGETTKAAAITSADLRRLIDRLNRNGLAGASVNGVLVALSAMLRFGVRRGVLDSNPVRLLERGDRPSARRKKEPRYLDRKQIDKLLAELGDEFRPVAMVMAFAALRVWEDAGVALARRGLRRSDAGGTWHEDEGVGAAGSDDRRADCGASRPPLPFPGGP